MPRASYLKSHKQDLYRGALLQRFPPGASWCRVMRVVCGLFGGNFCEWSEIPVQLCSFTGEGPVTPGPCVEEAVFPPRTFLAHSSSTRPVKYPQVGSRSQGYHSHTICLLGSLPLVSMAPLVASAHLTLGHTFVKCWLTHTRVICGLLILVHWSVCLFSCNNQAALRTIASEYHSKPGSMRTPTFFLSPVFFLAIWGLLWFHINLRRVPF